MPQTPAVWITCLHQRQAGSHWERRSRSSQPLALQPVCRCCLLGCQQGWCDWRLLLERLPAGVPWLGVCHPESQCFQPSLRHQKLQRWDAGCGADHDGCGWPLQELFRGSCAELYVLLQVSDGFSMEKWGVRLYWLHSTGCRVLPSSSFSKRS